MLRALGVAALVAVGGCGDPYGTTGPTKAVAKADPAAPAVEVQAPDPVVPDAPPEPKRIAKGKAGVTLLAPGQEPRETIALSASGKESRRLVIGMELGINTGKQDVPPTVMPELHALLVAEPKGEGEITYAFSIGGASRKDVEGSPPTERVAKAVDNAVAGLKEANGTITLSDRGVVSSFRLEKGKLGVPGLRPTLAALQQVFAQLFPVLPAEPVGVGARWKAVSHAELGGVHVQHEATYTLAKRSGDELELSVSFTQAATTESEEVAEHGGAGAAKITLDLRHVAPVKATASSRTQRNFSVKASQRPSAVKMDQALQLSLTAE